MSRFMRKVKVWFWKMERARSNKLAMKELQKFTDKELQDLGIGRSEIYAKVHGIK